MTDARIVFMGTERLAVPVLEKLAGHFNVIGVITRPDRPAGRGRKTKAPAVKELAARLGIPIAQPERLRTPEAMSRLREWAPDVIVVADFGEILRKDVLDLPPKGCVNVHASLLPRWRGASPIQHAILAGDKVTGVTIMLMDEGMDTGPILAQREVQIAPRETAATLTDKLSSLGAELLVETLPGYLRGEIEPRPQPDSGATHAKILRKADGEIHWDRPADEIDRMIRAFTPWPGTFTTWNGQRINILEARPGTGELGIGHVAEIGGEIAVGTGRGVLILKRVQPAGKRPMSARDFTRGRPGFVGSVLGGAG